MEAKLQQQAPQKVQGNKPNLTGIPTQMKLDFEQRSGLSFDDVRVHYNSDKPAQLQALAYTQGTQVYVGPGQERHLPHELGHIIQQKMGIVRPTIVRNGISINDSPMLEKMADCWNGTAKISTAYTGNMVVQRQNAFKLTEELTIPHTEVVDTFYETFVPPYDAQVISNVLENLVFEKVTADLLIQGIGTSHTYDNGQHTIYYSLNMNDYIGIPDIQEDYKKETREKNDSFSMKDFVRYAFLATMVHEFGHAIQEEHLNIHKAEVGTALMEHHNVLNHENLYHGRNRGVYSPLEEVFPVLETFEWTVSSIRKQQADILKKFVDPKCLPVDQLHLILLEMKTPKEENPKSNEARQINLFSEIIENMLTKPGYTQRDVEFFKSLAVRLMIESSTKKWFGKKFNLISEKLGLGKRPQE